MPILLVIFCWFAVIFARIPWKYVHVALMLCRLSTGTVTRSDEISRIDK
jgi:hypothetical protein